MKRMTTLISILVVAVVVAILQHLIFQKNGEIKKLESELEYYESTYLTRQGGTSLYNGTMLNYLLKSFDGGKSWYVCEYQNDRSIMVIGEAETIYPGLIANLDAWSALTDYVSKNGPIDPKNISPELDSIMTKAKIKIETK